jgi:glycerol-3-phosphate O-acyltransferase/dihydroxyacetone phosphate acyltransferase
MEPRPDPYTEPTLWVKLGYDLILWILSLVFDGFFREIRPRGAFRIPKKGAVIFVAAPHANQFVDPGILLKQVKKEANRRVSFLIAEKSMNVFGIGHMARLAMAIPVKRAQDCLRTATGVITMDAENPLKIIGYGTQFTKEATAKGLVGLPNSQGNAEIYKVISDTELILKKEFKKNAQQLLKNKTPFKVADKIDQHDVYEKVFAHLGHGQSIGIFPEGGSHDRTDLLPLKAGVAIMALGAMAHNSNCDVKIVPCGMNYFHPHKFRSRAVVEFGHPIEISKELVAKYANPETQKEATQQLLNTVEQGLRAVTVTCPDYETLMVVQTGRRLYTGGQKLPIPLVVEMNRRLVLGYTHFKDHPQVKQLKEKILDYNQQLKDFHLPDHEVDHAQVNYLKNFSILIHRSFKLFLLTILSLPGVVLFTPVFIVGKWYSKKKAKAALAASVVKIKANDVVATWKILIGMGLAPLLYTFYSVVGLYHFRDSSFNKFILFWIIYISGATVTYAALVCGDTGSDILKSIRPIYLSLIKPDNLLKLKETRKELTKEIVSVINELGPKLFPDFDHLTVENFDESAEDKKTEELKKRRREKRARDRRRLREEAVGEHKRDKHEHEHEHGIDSGSSSDSENFSNASIFASSDNESDTSETSVESFNNTEEYSTGVKNKVVDALRERRHVVDNQSDEDSD